MTFDEQVTLANNRPAGFDYLRLALSASVIATHTIGICFGRATMDAVLTGPARSILALILPMFFALSGFLVAGSLERSRTLVSFLGLRVLRIVPALMVDTAVAALVIGPLFTAEPLSAYLTNRHFVSYWLNVIGIIHFSLPGVFDDHVWPSVVNRQLWTLPFELECYLAIALLAVLGLVRSRRRLLVSVGALWLLVIISDGAFKHVGREVLLSGRLLVTCFLIGILCYFYRDAIPRKRSWAFVSAAACGVALQLPYGDYALPPFAAYLTAFIGTANPRRNKIVSSGDYSYGLFLYGFAIQQVVASAKGGGLWYVNFPVALALTAVLAVGSWWLVERPALKLKDRLFAFERVVGARVPLRHPVTRDQQAASHLAEPPGRQT